MDVNFFNSLPIEEDKKNTRMGLLRRNLAEPFLISYTSKVTDIHTIYNCVHLKINKSK